MTRADRPRLRQHLRAIFERLAGLLHRLPPDQPTFAAVVYQLRTRCGKSRCVCREGKLHSAWCVSYAERGQRKLRTLAPDQISPLRALADRYRRWRQVRAEMNRLFRQAMGLLDRLERSLRARPARALATRRREGS